MTRSNWGWHSKQNRQTTLHSRVMKSRHFGVLFYPTHISHLVQIEAKTILPIYCHVRKLYTIEPNSWIALVNVLLFYVSKTENLLVLGLSNIYLFILLFCPSVKEGPCVHRFLWSMSYWISDLRICRTVYD